MKKIINFLKNNILLDSIIVLLIIIVLNCLFELFNLKLRQNIIYFSIIMIIIGTIIGMIQLYKTKGKIVKRIIIGLSTLCIIFGIIFWQFIFFIVAFTYTPEHIVYKDGKKYVAQVYSWLDTTVRYYEYKNFFIMGSKQRIVENYYNIGIDVLADKNKERKPDNISYFDEDGKIIRNNNSSENNISEDILNTNQSSEKIESYIGNDISYEKTIELLSKFSNEYKDQLVNSEMNGVANSTGIYIYYSEKSNTDEILKNSIVDSIKSYLTVRENEPEGTYTIKLGNSEKYGKYIYVLRNELKTLRGTFKIDTHNKTNDNYKTIQTFEEILDSTTYKDKIKSKYGVDIKNKIKIWSLTTNNFMMNIECSEIETNKYSEYSNYVFETFKNLVESTYNMELSLVDNFSELNQ